MDLNTIQLGLEAVGAECTEVYEKYFEMKATHDSLDEQKKTILACYELKHSAEGRSQAEINRKALADEEYMQWIKGLCAAKEELNKTYARVKALETRLACYQSLSKCYLTEHQASKPMSL